MGPGGEQPLKTRSLLVRFPGFVFHPQALCPDRTLAQLAACLLREGHLTQIRDYGTVQTVDRLFPEHVREPGRDVVDRFFCDSPVNPLLALHTLWRMWSAAHAFRARRNEVCGEVAADLIRESDLDFILFHLEASEDLLPAAQVALQVRAQSPGVLLAACGSLVQGVPEPIPGELRAFDCLFARENELSIVEWAEAARNRGAWRHIPNLVFRMNGQTFRTSRKASDLGDLPFPAYEPETYPALEDGSKLKLFEIEDSRGCETQCFSCPSSTHEDGRVRTKPVSGVCDEIRHLERLHGAHAYDFLGTCPGPVHLAALAQALIRSGLDIAYIRNFTSTFAFPEVFELLKASGCQAVSFQIDTGSQWMLEDYFGRAARITQIEEMIRAARAAGLFSLVRLTFPTPVDDYHTREETLRLLDRTRPDAAPVDLPNVQPQSVWFQQAGRFGFGLDGAGSKTRWAGGRIRTPYSYDRWQAVPYRIGSLSRVQVTQAHESLVSAIEQRGILTAYSAKWALMGRILGFDGRPHEFSRRVLRSFCTGDISAVEALAKEFNEAACVPSAIAHEADPDAPFRKAVGN